MVWSPSGQVEMIETLCRTDTLEALLTHLEPELLPSCPVLEGSLHIPGRRLAPTANSELYEMVLRHCKAQATIPTMQLCSPRAPQAVAWQAAGQSTTAISHFLEQRSDCQQLLDFTGPSGKSAVQV